MQLRRLAKRQPPSAGAVNQSVQWIRGYYDRFRNVYQRSVSHPFTFSPLSDLIGADTDIHPE